MQTSYRVFNYKQKIVLVVLVVVVLVVVAIRMIRYGWRTCVSLETLLLYINAHHGLTKS